MADLHRRLFGPMGWSFSVSEFRVSLVLAAILSVWSVLFIAGATIHHFEFSWEVMIEQGLQE